MALNILALLILIFVTAFAVYLVFVLGGLPGRIAKQRNHPQADAIWIMGWLGLLTGGIVWAVALIWAYVNPRPVQLAFPSGKPEAAEAR
jgi:Protein of unknown function (DUF3302)